MDTYAYLAHLTEDGRTQTILEHLKGKDPSYYYSDVLIPNEKTLKDFIGG